MYGCAGAPPCGVSSEDLAVGRGAAYESDKTGHRGQLPPPLSRARVLRSRHRCGEGWDFHVKTKWLAAFGAHKTKERRASLVSVY